MTQRMNHFIRLLSNTVYARCMNWILLVLILNNLASILIVKLDPNLRKCLEVIDLFLKMLNVNIYKKKS